MNKYLFCLITAIISLALPASSTTPSWAAQPSIVVNTVTDGGVANDGFCTLTEAILVAGGDVLASATGACALPKGKARRITFDLPSLPATITMTNSAAGGDDRFIIDSKISVVGPGPDLLTLDADNLRAFNLHSGAVLTVSGTRVRNGSVAGFGGAFFLAIGSSLSLSDCIVDNNVGVVRGGAMYLSAGTSTTIENCFLFDNDSESSGGAIEFAPLSNVPGGSTLTVTRSAFFGNHAAWVGGAINILVANGGDAVVVIEDSQIFNNTANASGGAIVTTAEGSNDTASTTISGSSIAGNWAHSSPGGILNRAFGAFFGAGSATTTVTKSTVLGNASNNGPDTGQDILSHDFLGVATLNLNDTLVVDCIDNGTGAGTGCP